jgi:ABC-type transporter Mla MlaB component
MTSETFTEKATLIQLEGRLDAAAAPDLQTRLLTAIAEVKACLAIDLSQVSFVDSTGSAPWCPAFRPLAGPTATCASLRPAPRP